MTTQDKIKAVEKEIEILDKVIQGNFGIKEMTKYIKEFRRRTLKSCKEDENKKNALEWRDFFNECGVMENIGVDRKRIIIEKLKQQKEEITKLQEEMNQTELQKEFHWDRIKELEKTIKSLHLQNIDLLADKAEQKAKVEKLKGLDDMFLNKAKMNYSKEGDTWTILKKDWNLIVENVNKIFSPEEADLQERK